MTINTSPEFPISTSYDRGARVIGPFVIGVNSVFECEPVRFSIADPQPGDPRSVSFLRKRYPIVDIARFLSEDQGPGKDEAAASFCVGLSGGSEANPDLDLQVTFKSVRVGSEVLRNLNDNGALRQALTGKLTPDTFWLTEDRDEEPYTLLEGSFGSSAEQQKVGRGVRLATAMIDIAFAEMGKFDLAALDDRAIKNRDLQIADMPFGVA